MPSLVRLGYRAPPGAKKFYVFCFVCFLSVTLSNNKVCERHLAMNALEFGNDFGGTLVSLDTGMFVDAPCSTLSLQRWAEPPQNDKVEKR